jgi:hypothetical protein
MNKLDEQGKGRALNAEERHNLTMKNLEDQKRKINESLARVRNENKNTEVKLREDHGKTERGYDEILKQYDQEMYDKTKEIEKAETSKKETENELKQCEEQYQMRVEEARKQNEIENMIQIKEEQQAKIMSKLAKGAAWIQAHWKGLLARKEMEKALKKKRKGKRRRYYCII